MHPLFDTVIIGTSLRREAERHPRAAVAFARAAGAQVELIHALETRDVALGGMEWIPLEAWEEVCRELERDLQAQASRLGLSAREMDGVSLRNGAPHRVLAATASRPGTLLAVGASENARRPFLGTTAERGVRRASRPTLVVRAELHLPPCRLIVPVDFSPLAAGTLRTGIALAHQMHWQDSAPLEAVFVLPPPSYGNRPQLTPGVMRSRAAAALERFAAVEGQTALIGDVLLAGDPASELAAYLEPSDLLVLGTHGQGGFERLLLGSVASEVLRAAPCSVLLVPPHPALPSWKPAADVASVFSDAFHQFG